MSRDFGIAATSDLDLAGEVAGEVERLGFAGIWTNDTPAADGVRTAAAMAKATKGIRVGIGVVACDRRPPSALAEAVREARIPHDRLLLGVGPGLSPSPRATLNAAVEQLRELLPGTRIATAAMGPKMCALGGRLADAVLLNWMTPKRITWAKRLIEKGAALASRDAPLTAAYVRVADERGGDRISEEASRYAFLPHYARNFQAMGLDPASPGAVGVAFGDNGEEPGDGLAEYDRLLDITVARALPAGPSKEALLRLARMTAPNQPEFP